MHLKNAHKTPQFWLLWIILCMNVSAGIGIIGAASPMLQETFGGALVGKPDVGYLDLKKDATLAAAAAAVGAGFVGLISLFNIFGRIAWASSSDKLGRKTTYFIFFVLGAALYVLASFGADWKSLAISSHAFCVIASMYGGGFATIPAYLADMFGTQFVGAIHGRLLTAWSTAGIVGPVIVNYMHDTRQAAGVPPDQIYGPIFYILAGLLVVGFIANLLVRPGRSEMAYDATPNSPTSAPSCMKRRRSRKRVRSASARAGSMPRPCRSGCWSASRSPGASG